MPDILSALKRQAEQEPAPAVIPPLEPTEGLSEPSLLGSLQRQAQGQSLGQQMANSLGRTPLSPPRTTLVNPALADQRISSPFDMNERPNGLYTDRSTFESFIANLESVKESAIEGFGLPMAGLVEGFQRGFDELELAFEGEEEERETWEDIVRRERDYGMRSKLASAIRNATRADPKDVIPGFWTQGLPNVLGSSAVFLGGATLGTAVGIPPWITIGTMGSGASSLAFFEEAKSELLKQGVDEETAARKAGMAYAVGAAAGTTEAIAVGRIFDRLDDYSGGALSRSLKEKIFKDSVWETLTKDAAKSAVENAMQETFEQGMQNWTASDFVGYDPDRPLGENLWEAAKVGGGAGFLTVLAGGALGLKFRGTPIETKVKKYQRESEAQGVDIETFNRAREVRKMSEVLESEAAALDAFTDAEMQKLPPDVRAYIENSFARTGESGVPLGRIKTIDGELENALKAPVVLEDGSEISALELVLKQPQDAVGVAKELQEVTAFPHPFQVGKMLKESLDPELAAGVKDVLGKIRTLLGAFRKVANPTDTVLLLPQYSSGVHGAHEIVFVDNEGKLSDKWVNEEGKYNRKVHLTYLSPDRLAQAARDPQVGGRNLINTTLHELAHGFISSRLTELSARAYAALKNGVKDSKDIRTFKVLQSAFRKIFLDVYSKKTTESQFASEILEQPVDTSIEFGKQAPAIQMLLKHKLGGEGPSYWMDPHEVFARLIARWAGGAYGQTLTQSLGPAGQELDAFIKTTLTDLKGIYEQLPQSIKGPDVFAQLLDNMAGGFRVRQQIANPVGLEFINKFMKGEMSEREAAERFASWNTHLDTYNALWKIGASLPQLAWKNGHVRQLGRYFNWVMDWAAYIKRLTAGGIDLITGLKTLGKENASRLFNLLLEETASGKFRTAEEVATALGSKEVVDMYAKVHAHFNSILDEMYAVTRGQIEKMFRNTPDIIEEKLKEAKQQYEQLKSKPYFPFMRFGRFAVEARSKEDNRLIFSQWVDTKKEAKELQDRLRKEGAPRDDGGIEKDAKVYSREISDVERTSQGLPFDFIARLEENFKLSGNALTPEQIKVMKDLSYEYLPIRSFLRQFKQRKGLPGFSVDGMRIIASYTQNAAGHIARMKYGLDMKREIDSLRAEGRYINQLAKPEISDQSKRLEIADYMERHMSYIMDPGVEWAALRSLGFVYYLGYVVKSALVNGIQVPMATFNHLSALYGSVNAAKALSRAMGITTRYLTKPDSLTSDQIDLLVKSREQGWRDESLASELAVAATDGVVDRYLPFDLQGRFRGRELKKIGKHAYYKFAHWSSLPFHVMEKFNRTITALAQYELSREAGASHEEAISQARTTVMKTQGEYASWARPLMMRGRKGSLFLFKSYLQNMLYFIGNEPGGMRFLAMLAVIAGMQGLPGADDLLDLFDGLGTEMKEKLGLPDTKVDIRTELRKDILEMFDGLESAPDLLLHGISSQSFGLGLLGEALGVPIPNVDLSGSLSMGNILPATEVLQRAKIDDSPQALLGTMAEEIAGPLGSMGVGVISPLIRHDPDIWRRWERALPLFMRGPSKALRIATRGGEVTAGGELIADFDINDPRDRADLLVQTFGFTPRKLSRGWERYMAELEASSYWTGRKALLMADYNHVTELKDREGIADALKGIKLFNRQVPYPEMSVTAEEMRKSTKTYLIRRAKLERGIALQQDFIRLKNDYAKAYGAIPEEGSPRSDAVVPPAAGASSRLQSK